MNTTTSNSMNLNLQKSDIRITIKVPIDMRDFVKKISDEKKMTVSAYIKYAINNQLQRDLSE
jgi:hypothetical protein